MRADGIAITYGARRSLIALVDGLASDPEEGDQSAQHVGRASAVTSPAANRALQTTGVAIERGLDESVPGAGRCSWTLSVDRRTLTVGRVVPLQAPAPE